MPTLIAKAQFGLQRAALNTAIRSRDTGNTFSRKLVTLKWLGARSSLLWLSLFLFAFFPAACCVAEAVHFDCARAALKVDFVICRTPAGLAAVDKLTTIWRDFFGQTAPENKPELLRQQRQWIVDYSAQCGVAGRDRPAPDPSLKTDDCVLNAIKSRTDVLAASLRNQRLGHPVRVGAASTLNHDHVSVEQGSLTHDPKSNTDCVLRPKINISNRAELNAEDWLSITWARCAPASQLMDPTFLIISVPEEVRLRGSGFFALRRMARAPFGFNFDNSRTRIIIPLHQSFLATSGIVEISPLAVGDFPIDATVFQHKADKNIILWQSNKIVKTILPGPPEVDIWQEVPPDPPREVRYSNDNRWELRIFKEEFEVVDRASGSLLMRQVGTAPAFSPTQRFLVADTTSGVLLYDLVARRTVRNDLSSVLIWLYEDSIIVEDNLRWASSTIINTLIDDKSLDITIGSGGHAATAWDSAQLDINIDSGYIISSQYMPEQSIASLASPIDKLGPVDLRSTTRRNLVPFIKKYYDVAYAGPPVMWRVHDAIKMVSTAAANDDGHRFIVESSHSVAPVQHSKTPNASISIRPFTRGLARGKDGDNPVVLDKKIERMIGNSFGEIEYGLQAIDVEADTNVSSEVVPLYKNDTGIPSKLVTSKLGKFCGSYEVENPSAARFKLGDEVLEVVPESLGEEGLQRIVFWPQTRYDPTVITFFPGGNLGEFSDSHILRRAPDGSWVWDCRAIISGSTPPKTFMFSQGDIVLVHPERHQLVYSPGLLSAPTCTVDNLLRADTLQAIARISGAFLMLISNTGDIDVFACPSGKHLISGALLDDELVVYSEEGWFDGSREALGFIQLRMSGVAGQFLLSQFEGVLRRPGLLREVLSGKALPHAQLGSPPTLRLNADKGGLVEARDKSALRAIRFFNDGVLVKEVPVYGKESSVSVPIDELSDARQVVVVAVNAAGIESASLPLKHIATKERKGHLRGLTVGVDNFEDPHIPQLNFAEADAVKLAKALNTNDHSHLDASVQSLVGSAATPQAILDRLDDKIAGASASDTIVFGFAGHGIVEHGELLLVLSTMDYRNAETTALRWKDVEERLTRSAARVIVFIDACHSGAATIGSEDQHEAAIDRLNSRPGPPMLIFAASKAGQLATESQGNRGGLFTSAVVDVIGSHYLAAKSAPTDLLTLDSLYGAVKRKVFIESKGTQIPWFGRRGLNGDFVLF